MKWRGKVTRGQIASAARFLFGFGLAYLLIRYTLDFTGVDLGTEVGTLNVAYLIAVVVLHGAGLIAMAYRWALLLRVQGIDIGLWEATKLTFIGGFFNLVIPGPVSGDIVKGLLAMKSYKGKKAPIALAIVLDRTIGVAVLAVLSCIAILFYISIFVEMNRENEIIERAIVAIASVVLIVGLLLVAVLVFSRLSDRTKVSRITKPIIDKLPERVINGISTCVDAFARYRHNKTTLAKAIFITFMIHGVFALDVFLIGKSTGESSLVFLDYFVASQIGSLLTIVPITPGGIGLRDVGIAVILSTLNATPGKAGIIPLLMTSVIVGWRLIGGAIFLISTTMSEVMQLVRENEETASPV